MQFTSQIVKISNQFAPKHGRSLATKAAFKAASVYHHIMVVDVEKAFTKAFAHINAEIFRENLNKSKKIFKLTFFAMKHGEKVTRDAISVTYAIEKRLYTPSGGEEKRNPDLVIYYDLTQNGVRAFRKENFVGAE